MEQVALNINGKSYALNVEPDTPLLFVLRNQLGLTGAKLGCGLEQCGACAVLVDGHSTLICTKAAIEFQGKEIITVEGLVKDGVLNLVQQAFLETGAAQCGYCIPGLVVAVTGMLEQNSKPDAEAIRAALAPHLCRCGSQGSVMRAIEFLVT